MALCISGGMVLSGQNVNDAEIAAGGNFVGVKMEMDLSGMVVKSDRAVVLTPYLVAQVGTASADTLYLPTVGIYGRQRFYFYARRGAAAVVGGETAQSFMAKHRPETLVYSRAVEWPEAAGRDMELCLRRSEYGCCGSVIARSDTLIARVQSMQVAQVQVEPVEEAVPPREGSVAAFVDYVIDRAEIDADYMHNREEIEGIVALIDSLRADPGIKVTGIRLRGYASPEGSYAHNADLAKARTEAVRDFIMRLYDFGDGVIETDFEPEDWAGLRRFVENAAFSGRGGLRHSDEILGVIDGGGDPDAKERKIRSAWPDDYKYIRENCYPALRRTECRIFYTIIH